MRVRIAAAIALTLDLVGSAAAQPVPAPREMTQGDFVLKDFNSAQARPWT